MSTSKDQATRDAGLSKAARFIESGLAGYAKTRNFDFGPDRRGNVSVLSAHLRHRLLLEEELLAAVVQTVGLSRATKYVEEVFWRAYFKGWLEHRPDVWRDYRADLDTLLQEPESNAELLERYTTAVEGNTGIDCFDAWSRELIETGYLHNHARMWFASIWVFTLHLPWQLGADFFYRHLIDGDAASNTLSWRWVCGLHTRGKTYLARVSNIVNFTNQRFNPAGMLAVEAEALQEPYEYDERPLPLLSNALPDARYGLLVTEDDGHPESLDTRLSPAAIIGAVGIRNRSPLPVGEPAFDFAVSAVSGSAERAGGYWNRPATSFESVDWSKPLVDFCRRNDLQHIVTAFTPTGTIRDTLDAARPALSKAGIELHFIQRSYDQATWPHCSRGYFRLKKKIPSLVSQMQLSARELPPQLAAIADCPQQQELPMPGA